MKPKLTVEATYDKAISRLPPDRARAANQALVKFVENPSWPSLKFRALKGKSNYFIISAAHGDRVIVRKDQDDIFAAVDVGPHDNIYRRWDRK